MILGETDPGREPYLAVPTRVYEGILSERFGQVLVARLRLRFIVFDENEGRILRWIEPNNTG